MPASLKPGMKHIENPQQATPREHTHTLLAPSGDLRVALRLEFELAVLYAAMQVGVLALSFNF